MHKVSQSAIDCHSNGRFRSLDNKLLYWTLSKLLGLLDLWYDFQKDARTPDKLEALNINIYLLLSFVTLANFSQVYCRLCINDTIVIPIEMNIVLRLKRWLQLRLDFDWTRVTKTSKLSFE